MNYVRYYISVVVIDTLSAWVVYIFFPNYRNYLLQEGSLIENLSAFLFLSTFLVAFSLAIKKKGNYRALFLISAIGLLGFLDELSYGEELFGLSMPRIFDKKINGLHDFYLAGYKQLVKFIPAHATSVYLILTVAAASLPILLYRYRSKVWRQLSTTHRYPPYILVLLVVVFIVFALVLDSRIIVKSLHIGKYDPLGLVVWPFLQMLEEMLEMNVGIGLLFCSLSLYDSGSSQEQTKKSVVAVVVKTTERLGSSQRWIGVAGAGVVVFVFWILIWFQGWLYQDRETLGRGNVAKWAFHYVQGNVFADRGELKKAIRHYRKALKYSPGNSAIHFNLGNALVRQDNLDEAIEHFRRTLLIQPEFAEAHESLGRALAQQGKRDEAAKHLEEALRIMKARRDASESR